MPEAFFLTAAGLAQRGGDYPDEFVQARHLVYSSPATLSFNSPGAEGFGVKRAGLAVPGSVMLLVAPACCGRNTSALQGTATDCAERTYYLLLDDTDIVTGRYLSRIPDACAELVESLPEPPSAIMVCMTCVDALLGTDEDRVCSLASARAGVPVVSCTMYALTREGRIPPMVGVRRTVYSLLEKRRKDPRAMNILGYFMPLADSTELYPMCRKAGLANIRELSRCKDMEDYHQLSEANFNLVLHPESRHAAQDLSKRLGIPYIELARVHDPDKIHRQYQLFGEAIGVRLDDASWFEQASQAYADMLARHGALSFALGETSDADPFELALTLLRKGFRVAEIFGTMSPAKEPLVRRIAELSPDTRIYSNLSPSMLFYEPNKGEVDVAVGKDASWYHPESAGIAWCGPSVPFGYDGVTRLLSGIEAVLADASQRNMR